VQTLQLIALPFWISRALDASYSAQWIAEEWAFGVSRDFEELGFTVYAFGPIRVTKMWQT
jgi:hypothetical protein